MSAAKRTILITGTSSGMGRACALRLARAGYRVFGSVRTPGDAERLRAEGLPTLTPVILDVTSSESIERARETIETAVGGAGLQGLVNNAGTGFASPIEHLPLERLRAAYEVNLLGQVSVIQAFLPLVRAGRGRIINVGSVGGRVAIPFGSAICSTKAAFESLTDSLRLELRQWGIPVVLVAPGSIHTPAVERLAGDAEKLLASLPEEGRSLYGPAFKGFVGRFVSMEQKGVGPEVMAAVVERALTARSPRRRYPVGPKSRLLPLLSRLLPGRVMDGLKARLFGLTPS